MHTCFVAHLYGSKACRDNDEPGTYTEISISWDGSSFTVNRNLYGRRISGISVEVSVACLCSLCRPAFPEIAFTGADHRPVNVRETGTLGHDNCVSHPSCESTQRQASRQPSVYHDISRLPTCFSLC